MFEIYKRINSGGENLNDQQARKAAFWCDTPVTCVLTSHKPVVRHAQGSRC